MNVLFVCSANTCRSPLAEAVMRDHIAKNNLTDHFAVDSAGTSQFHVGEGVDFRSRMVAQQNHVPIVHVSRQLTQDDFNTFQYMLVMDNFNHQEVTSLAKKYSSPCKILYLREFDPEAQAGAYSMDMPDPAMDEATGFEEIFKTCKRSVEGFVQTVVPNNFASAAGTSC